LEDDSYVAALSHIKLFVLDMDGTVYLGDSLFPWTSTFLNAVMAAGADYMFLTNNSSKTADLYVEKLNRLGIRADRGRVLTSGDATIQLLKMEARWKRIYLVATAPVARDFERAGIELTADNPDAGVLTFDTTLNYEKLEMLCFFVRRGLPFIVSHPDINCPTPQGPKPDVGAFLALIESSTGRLADRIVGKPMPDILLAAMSRKGVKREETMIVGDRLYTDIACGIAAGVSTALVLSGESTREMAAESPHKPDYIFSDIGEIAPLLGPAGGLVD